MTDRVCGTLTRRRASGLSSPEMPGARTIATRVAFPVLIACAALAPLAIHWLGGQTLVSEKTRATSPRSALARSRSRRGTRSPRSARRSVR
jgi:hypothetical protein